jgi:hypothetical protein
MVIQLKTKQKNLYETDYDLWVLDTVEKLKTQDFDKIDWENLIEEVGDLSRRDRHKIESLLIRLIEHLLKLGYWEFERERNRGHWEGEITNFRVQIKLLLKASPSLKSYLSDVFEECYLSARKIASKRSQLPLNHFPEKSLVNLEEILDENWLP